MIYMNIEIYKVVIYNCVVKGENIRKSCIYYNNGTIRYGNYEDGIESIKTMLKEKGLNSKDGMSILAADGSLKILTEEEFLKNKYEYAKEVEEVARSYFATVVEEANDSYDSEIEDIYEDYNEDTDYNNYDSEVEDTYEDYDVDIDTDNSYDSEIEDEDVYDDEEIIIEEENNDILVNRAGKKIKENHLGLKILAGALGIMVGLGLYASSHRKSKTGEMTDSNIVPNTNITDITDDNDIIINPTNNNQENNINIANNDLYNGYSFSDLLNVTTNLFQKDSMIRLAATLNHFNGTFANSYKENGNNIRAALTFDEAVSLQHAYNSYTIDEVRAYFNGSEIRAENLSNAYKDASLQLMGAYVIEDRQNPVDMSNLIDSQEGKDFYNRYHEMFLAAKEATGAERTRLVNIFYQAVREDFPITQEIRTTGISHADDRNSLKDYQLAVTPIIAASEILFEKTTGVNKLDTTEMDFLNDIGLCNHADDKFERIETIMLSSYEDNTNPLYTQYRSAIINELENNNIYVIDNQHRELANLRSFQIKVNGNNNSLGRYSTMYNDTTFVDSTETHEEVISWEETSTSTRTETSIVEGEITDSERSRIDSEIASENNAARTEALRRAEEERRRLQEEANREAETIRNQIDQDNQQLQNDIDDINNRINNGDKVNETDINDNINIDSDRIDENGNLDDSIHNITTDPIGAGQDLPNPEDTEEEFNRRTLNSTSYNSVVEETTYTPIDEEPIFYIEYGEDYLDFDENGEVIQKNKTLVYTK